jgi:hypothetical protein
MEQMFVDTAFTEVSSDYSPQLSGILDTNGNDIIIDNGGAIEDDSNNEYVKFVKTATAVNEVSVTNAAASGAPEISATGDDTDIDLKITPKGSGKLNLDGIKFPNADGTVDQVLVTETVQVIYHSLITQAEHLGKLLRHQDLLLSQAKVIFCDTSGGAFTATLPLSPTLGDEVTFVDYAGTFDTNNLTVGRNSENIQGSAAEFNCICRASWSNFSIFRTLLKVGY